MSGETPERVAVMSPDQAQAMNPGSRRGRPLAGVRICLIFEHSLTHYTRILQEIDALREAGATVRLLTSHVSPDAPPEGMQMDIAPLSEFSLKTNRVPCSTLAWRPLRIADNLVREVLRPIFARLEVRQMARTRRRTLEEVAKGIDLFWVIDYPSLPSAMAVARRAGIRLVYETVDLVPEYFYSGRKSQQKHLNQERRLVAHVDGFITACDGYADYYLERYGSTTLTRRPVVRNDMPDHTVTRVRRSVPPLRMIFLGSLMSDRPVIELIDAMALVSADVRLVFQGKNYLGEAPSARILELGLADRVRILDPCPSDEIVETAGEYDIGIVSLYGTNENERRASTTKLFTYMAAGLAVLGSDLPGIARVVKPLGNGVLVNGTSPEGWARAIDELVALPPEALDGMKQKSLEAAQTYAWERQKPQFVDEFVRALTTTGP